MERDKKSICTVSIKQKIYSKLCSANAHSQVCEKVYLTEGQSSYSYSMVLYMCTMLHPLVSQSEYECDSHRIVNKHYSSMYFHCIATFEALSL